MVKERKREEEGGDRIKFMGNKAAIGKGRRVKDTKRGMADGLKGKGKQY